MMYSFTINTDASFDPNTRTAAWGCWIKSTHYKIQQAGLFPKKVANSSVAELMAIEQALALLHDLICSQEFLRAQRDGEGIKLYFNTDSMFAIGALKGEIKRSNHLQTIRRISLLVEGYDIEVRHVKAHRKIKDARTYVNDWCDRSAKRLVRQRVEQLNGPTRKKV